jgi:DNA-binding XRE family transcriptional regulator
VRARSAAFCDGWWKNSLFAPAGVGREAGMTGPELRFIRTEMGMTQAELAKVVHHDAQSIGRWERSEFAIDQTAEALIKLHSDRKGWIETGRRDGQRAKRAVRASRLLSMAMINALQASRLIQGNGPSIRGTLRPSCRGHVPGAARHDSQNPQSRNPFPHFPFALSPRLDTSSKDSGSRAMRSLPLSKRIVIRPSSRRSIISPI